LSLTPNKIFSFAWPRVITVPNGVVRNRYKGGKQGLPPLRTLLCIYEEKKEKVKIKKKSTNKGKYIKKIGF